MFQVYVVFALMVYATIMQVLDVVSTSLVISKGRGREANPAVLWWMGKTGKFWGLYKIPVIAFLWYAGLTLYVTYAIILLAVVSLVYSYVIWNNYSVAWRKF